VNLELAELFFGKRFSGLIVTVAALTLGFFFGDPAVFPTFATTLGLLYGAYVTGQSVTDARDK
jgi:hypothetical protein